MFLCGASASVLIVSRSPHGLEEIHRLYSWSTIGAASADLWTLGALSAVTVLTVVLGNR